MLTDLSRLLDRSTRKMSLIFGQPRASGGTHSAYTF
jgi:hypothetical protein